MADQPDGGPAFPTALGGVPKGMSLRDHFAESALNGMISSESNGIDRTKVNKRKWADVAYEFADAMLAARAKERP